MDESEVLDKIKQVENIPDEDVKIKDEDVKQTDGKRYFDKMTGKEIQMTDELREKRRQRYLEEHPALKEHLEKKPEYMKADFQIYDEKEKLGSFADYSYFMNGLVTDFKLISDILELEELIQFMDENMIYDEKHEHKRAGKKTQKRGRKKAGKKKETKKKHKKKRGKETKKKEKKKKETKKKETKKKKNSKITSYDTYNPEDRVIEKDVEKGKQSKGIFSRFIDSIFGEQGGGGLVEYSEGKVKNAEDLDNYVSLDMVKLYCPYQTVDMKTIDKRGTRYKYLSFLKKLQSVSLADYESKYSKIEQILNQYVSFIKRDLLYEQFNLDFEKLSMDECVDTKLKKIMECMTIKPSKLLNEMNNINGIEDLKEYYSDMYEKDEYKGDILYNLQTNDLKITDFDYEKEFYVDLSNFLGKMLSVLYDDKYFTSEKVSLIMSGKKVSKEESNEGMSPSEELEMIKEEIETYERYSKDGVEALAEDVFNNDVDLDSAIYDHRFIMDEVIKYTLSKMEDTSDKTRQLLEEEIIEDPLALFDYFNELSQEEKDNINKKMKEKSQEKIYLYNQRESEIRSSDVNTRIDVNTDTFMTENVDVTSAIPNKYALKLLEEVQIIVVQLTYLMIELVSNYLEIIRHIEHLYTSYTKNKVGKHSYDPIKCVSKLLMIHRTLKLYPFFNNDQSEEYREEHSLTNNGWLNLKRNVKIDYLSKNNELLNMFQYFSIFLTICEERITVRKEDISDRLKEKADSYVDVEEGETFIKPDIDDIVVLKGKIFMLKKGELKLNQRKYNWFKDYFEKMWDESSNDSDKTLHKQYGMSYFSIEDLINYRVDLDKKIPYEEIVQGKVTDMNGETIERFFKVDGSLMKEYPTYQVSIITKLTPPSGNDGDYVFIWYPDDLSPTLPINKWNFTVLSSDTPSEPINLVYTIDFKLLNKTKQSDMANDRLRDIRWDLDDAEESVLVQFQEMVERSSNDRQPITIDQMEAFFRSFDLKDVARYALAGNYVSKLDIEEILKDVNFESDSKDKLESKKQELLQIIHDIYTYRTDQTEDLQESIQKDTMEFKANTRNETTINQDDTLSSTVEPAQSEPTPQPETPESTVEPTQSEPTPQQESTVEPAQSEPVRRSLFPSTDSN